MLVFAFVCALALQTATTPDPLQLQIRSGKQIAVRLDQITDLRTGRKATVQDIVKTAANTRYLYLGEEHTDPAHHETQAEVIRALAASGRDVVVGMEQFTRPVQPALDGWTLGWYSDDDFIQKSDWEHQWGMPYNLYKPVFDAVKDLHLALIALNIPRAWVHEVGTGGLSALTAEQRVQLPSEIDLANRDHKAMFTAMMGGHPMTGMDNMYAAQVLWDVAMADTAVKYMANRPSRNTIMVILAGSGHVMYGQGINWRVAKRTGDTGITMVMGESDQDRAVSQGVGDFFYLTKPPAGKS